MTLNCFFPINKQFKIKGMKLSKSASKIVNDYNLKVVNNEDVMISSNRISSKSVLIKPSDQDETLVGIILHGEIWVKNINTDSIVILTSKTANTELLRHADQAIANTIVSHLNSEGRSNSTTSFFGNPSIMVDDKIIIVKNNEVLINMTEDRILIKDDLSAANSLV